MGAAVLVPTRCGLLGGAYICVHCCEPGVSLDIVQPDPFHPDRRVSMTKVQECSGRAHRSKGPGCDHIHRFEGPFLTEFVNQGGHLLCSNNSGVAVGDPLVDQANGLLHRKYYSYEYLYLRLLFTVIYHLTSWMPNCRYAKGSPDQSARRGR